MAQGRSERPGPPGGKRDLNRRKRVDDIMQAGIQLFLAKGIDNVTIDHIAKEAGTAKGNFYRYFEDKTSLVTAILEPIRSDIATAMERCEVELLAATGTEALFAAYQTLGMSLGVTFLREPHVVRFFLEENGGLSMGARAPVRQLDEEISEAATRLTRVACEHGLLRIEDPRVSALAVVGAVDRLVLAVLRGRLDGDPLAITQMLVRLVLDGIRARDV